MRNLSIVTIVGRPNVGKSTLFNRLIGTRGAVTDQTPGTTRDKIAEKVSWNNKDFLLVDTAGFLVDFFGFKEEEIERQAQGQIRAALQDSELVLLVTDGKIGLTSEDQEIARIVRGAGREAILVVNKVESTRQKVATSDFSRLGFEETLDVSAVSGRGSGKLLDQITDKLVSQKAPEDTKTLKLAIVGRPNVGKSTIFNQLVGFKRAIVAPSAGTTRDSLKERVGQFEIIDTAGFRRRGKILPGIEKFSVLRSIASIVQADLVVLVVDAQEGLTRGDTHLLELILRHRKQVIVALNKIDLLKAQTTDQVPNLERFSNFRGQKMVAVCAQSGQNLNQLRQLLDECAKEILTPKDNQPGRRP